MNIKNILIALCFSIFIIGCHSKDANTAVKEKTKEELNHALDEGNSRVGRVSNQRSYCGSFPTNKDCPVYHENYCTKYPTSKRDCPFSYEEHCKSSPGEKECSADEHAIELEAFCQGHPKESVCQKK